MKNFRFKLLTGIFTFIIVVTAFYLAAKLKPEIFDIFCTASAIEEVPMPEIEEDKLPEIEKIKLSDRIEVRFVEFSKNEDADYTLAKFEVTNKTSGNAYYYGFFKESYPFPEIKRKGKIVDSHLFRCGTGLKKQTLLPGETVTFQVPEYEFNYEITNNLRQKTYKPTQIGFPFQIGEENGFDQTENGREIYFWSEEITFPVNTLSGEDS